MPLARILVDGYSLLHAWPELAPGAAPHSERARDALVRMLRKYHDASSHPITVFFDGAGRASHSVPDQSDRNVEILFSGAGRTADDLIERAAHRFLEFGAVLVVTDDSAERDTVIGLGGSTTDCHQFIQMAVNTLAEFADELKNRNRAERRDFGRPR
ncbi:MAG: NYN domain-containing protein [Verrucomicrobia bacterium]|nr:NYN domain-containing protein [Verrucomicrobiota bacterium]MDE3098574.1 NYN domain-containing protein [Verrucomicrobiota bacterium]